MEFSRTAIGMLAVVCLAAGAGGTFLAVRSNSSPANPPEAQVEPATTTGTAVAESEALIADPPVTPELPKTTAPIGKPLPPKGPTPRRAVTPTPHVQDAKTTSSAPAVTSVQRPAVPVEPPVVVDNQASRSVDPPGPIYEELVVAADSVIGLQLESPITSERAQVEDSVVARVTRDVRVSDRVVIPSGARALGEVTVVERGGKLRERARLGIRFTSIVLADGTRLPIHTETIYRDGDPPGRESATKIGGGAIGGAILGGLLGGAKGAAIGSAIGGGAGTAAVMASDRNHAVIPTGAPLTVRLEDPVVITVER